MYTQSAKYYDLLYRDLKDYGEEVRKIDLILNRIEPRPKQLLDVGCGTGEHARLLQGDFGYAVDGLDLQADFIKIARSKCPNARFETADMRSFELGRQYDAILCLFSSIGYVETLEGLHRALEQFAKHLKPDGWLILEPWITPENWNPGQVDTVEATDSSSGQTIERVRTGRTEGRVSVIEIDYQIKSSREHRTFKETHRLGLFTKEEMQNALTETGFEAMWMPMGLHVQSMAVAKRA